jgi:hypothetical protein
MLVMSGLQKQKGRRLGQPCEIWFFGVSFRLQAGRMRLFLIVANTVFVVALFAFFRQEVIATGWSQVDAIPVILFFSVVALACLNVGYILTTRTDKSVIARARRFMRAWKNSADEA